MSLGEACQIYEEEWDLLIVLDACRYDLMESVGATCSFIHTVDHRYSPASSSKGWLQQQFRPEYAEELRRTAYINGNPYSAEILNQSDFALLDDVWQYGWNEEMGTVLPRVITDRAITVAREDSPRRMIAHYMQPHFPALDDPGLGGQVDPERNQWINSVWSQLQTGELTHETVWNAYRSNLEAVLTEVELLLNNTDFETVVITADHGNGFGENDIYGHPSNRVHPVLRKVPWITTTASDSGTHTPETYDRRTAEVSLTDRLGALGYR